VLAATANLSPPRPVEAKATERPARVVTQLLEPATDSEPGAEAAAGSLQEAAEPASPTARTPAPRPVRSASGARAVPDAKPASDAPRIGAVAEAPQQIEPPIQQARANIAPSQSDADDGKSLASMLDKCSGEKFLAGVICEQKVRLRYCEGKWGQVPQCTKPPHVD